MKDHSEIGQVTKFDALRVNRDKLATLRHGWKSIQMCLILRQRPSKSFKFCLPCLQVCLRKLNLVLINV